MLSFLVTTSHVPGRGNLRVGRFSGSPSSIEPQFSVTRHSQVGQYVQEKAGMEAQEQLKTSKIRSETSDMKFGGFGVAAQ